MSDITHVNSEREKISIRKLAPGHPFAGNYLLVIHDDPRPLGTGTEAPTLLDVGTAEWLKQQCEIVIAEAMEVTR